MCVLREIDDLKKNQNSEIGQKARKAAVTIAKNMNISNIEFTLDDPKGVSADDQLLQLTKEYNGILVTNDISLKVRAKVLGIDTEGYSFVSDYVGAYYLNISDMSREVYNSILAELCETGIFECEDHAFSYNEYLIIPPPDYDASLGKVSIYKFNGTKFEPVKFKTLESNWTDDNSGIIKPRNPEQICLIDAILNEDNKIIYVGGTFGTGKTYCTHHYAINQLEKEKIKKIVYVPNNSYTQNTMDLGALPGDMIEKIQPLIGPLIDIVGIVTVLEWIKEEKLEIVPMAYIRGRNFTDSIVIVSEAENLTEEHIKLLVGRCGEGTRIFFDGDIHQADSAIFKDRNGLQLLLELHKSPELSRIFSTIQLVTIERSMVAAAADYLDKL